MKTAIGILVVAIGLLPVFSAVSSPLVNDSAAACCCGSEQPAAAPEACCCCAPEPGSNATPSCDCSIVPVEAPAVVAVMNASKVHPCKGLALAYDLPITVHVQPALSAAASHVLSGINSSSGPPVPVLYCAFLC